MDTIRPNRLLCLLISLILLLGGVVFTQAAPLRSVGLLSFEATALENAVRLDWETATELQTAGFIIKRSVNGGAFISLPDIGIPGFIDAEGNPAGFVISEGGPAEGATYQEMDNDVQAGSNYTYKLVEVENDNSEVELDTQSVAFGSASTATATAQPSVTHTPGSPVTATATPLPSSTTPSSSTPLPTPTSTSTASNGNTNGPPNTTAATAPTAVPTALPPIAAPTTQSETVIESAESGDEGLTSTQATTSNIVLAQAETTATAVPPIPTEATNNGDTTYPGFQVTVEPTQEPVTPTAVLLEVTPAYPAATRSVGEDPGGADVPVIGSQTNNQSEDNAANSSQAASGKQLGRIYLWGGFLLSLLVFITTVVATILLFTRKRTQ